MEESLIEKRIAEVELERVKLNKIISALKQEHQRNVNNLIKNEGALEELKKLKESFKKEDD
ncbi:hypothetical protein LCGC14_1392180 [marine sediment metagenome]|uniref:Uncharacterized protein n=1 Tax=marine sediment metagenome TaxID=412755 RepID=A0A0F9N171_9ZZZZ|nr:hypothetical protein [Candidatus Aminicenantes bacterium]